MASHASGRAARVAHEGRTHPSLPLRAHPADRPKASSVDSRATTPQSEAATMDSVCMRATSCARLAPPRQRGKRWVQAPTTAHIEPVMANLRAGGWWRRSAVRRVDDARWATGERRACRQRAAARRPAAARSGSPLPLTQHARHGLSACAPASGAHVLAVSTASVSVAAAQPSQTETSTLARSHSSAAVGSRIKSSSWPPVGAAAAAPPKRAGGGGCAGTPSTGTPSAGAWPAGGGCCASGGCCDGGGSVGWDRRRHLN